MAEVFSTASLAKEWGCSYSTIHGIITSGRLKAWRAGGKLYRIDPAAADAYLEEYGHPLDTDKDRRALVESVRSYQKFENNIYFASTDEFVKIGQARKSNLLFRMWAIQCMNPKPIVLIGLIEGTITEEQALHRRFRHLHQRGEWFRREGDLVEFVNAIPRKGVPTGTFVPEPVSGA